jgi:hypothetical protein
MYRGTKNPPENLGIFLLGRKRKRGRRPQADLLGNVWVIISIPRLLIRSRILLSLPVMLEEGRILLPRFKKRFKNF